MRDLIRQRYTNHRNNCKRRGIELRLTIDEWFAIWQASGKWDLYGCRKGQYCMSRINDTGHYEVGNVFIQLHAANVREASVLTDRKPPKQYGNNWNAGRIQSAEANKKRSEALIGRKRSAEHIANNVAARKANAEKRKQENK